MRKSILLFLIILIGKFLYGQELQTTLFQNVNIKGKVLQLEVTPEYEDAYFVIGLGKNRQIVANTNLSIAGNKIYDICQLNAPVNLDVIATNLPESAILKKALIKPSIGQEFAILFSKNAISLRSVNLVFAKNFFGHRYTLVVLFLVFCCFLLLRFGLKKSYLNAALVSTIIGFVLSDLTSISDQLDGFQLVEKNYPYLTEVAASQQFIGKAKPKMENGAFIFQNGLPDEYQKLFMKYHFADVKYFHKKRGESLAKDVFLIPPKSPNVNRKLIESGNGFSLQQKQ